MDSFRGVSPHRPLSHDGSEFRTVMLLPSARFDAPIECKLEHAELKPAADYEAVSYCWGDASDTRTISLDNRPYPITLNLFNGLRYLRRRDTPRKLWVDSLCINQTDTAERSREILKMQHIYRAARRVLIWVGDYRPYTPAQVKEIFLYVERFAEAHTQEQSLALTRQEKWDVMWERHSELQQLLQNWKWFERMWVIQEVVVRPQPTFRNLDRVPRFICGELSLPYSYLRYIHDLWVVRSGNRYLSLPPLCRSFGYLCEIWSQHEHIMRMKVLTLPEKIFWILSRVAARFRSTDARDIVYATIGLLGAESIPHELFPDYRKNVPEVFTEYATYLLSNSRLLAIVQYNSMRTEGLPSWVPDWQHDPISFGPFTESESWDHIHVRLLREISALEVDIIVCSEIVAVGPKFEHEGLPEELIRSWQLFFFDAEEDLDGRNIPPEGYTDFATALWQLLLAYDYRTYDLHDPGWHYSAGLNPPPPFLGCRGHGRQAPGLNDRYYRDIENDELISLADSILDKYVFRADDGSIGIVGQRHVEPRPGDLVCVMKGVYADFILRDFADGYRIVGVCERSLRGCEMAIRDYGGSAGFERWLRKDLLVDFYQDFWNVNQGERVRIY
ncbi:HET-domain-containing protein [Xylariaceae sp. FL0594]|nr:HET-domain-containing protein [Xylariaceae sp. FL0594]